MKKGINYLIFFGQILSILMVFNACKDDLENDEVFIFQPINLTYSLDEDKFSSTYNMGTFTWEDRDETPATHYIVTTYKGLIEEGGTAISTVKEVAHVEGVTEYSVLVDEKLNSGTIYEVEIMPYMDDVEGHAASISFESVVNDIIGTDTYKDNYKVITSATTATFKWMPIGIGVAKKIIVTPSDDSSWTSEETPEVVEMEIPSDASEITVEGLISFTSYSAELFDKNDGVVGRYEFKTSMAGGVTVYNNDQLYEAIQQLMSSGGAITLSTEQGTNYYEYTGALPTADFFLMGSEDYDGTQASTATIKLSVEYQERSSTLSFMRLNIDGNNELEHFITFEDAVIEDTEQDSPAASTGIVIEDCWVVNYTGSAIYSPKEAYHYLESISITNTTFANIVGSLIDFRMWDEEGVNSKFEAGNPYWCSAVKDITIDRTTIYNVATIGGTVEGDEYTRGNSLIRIDSAKDHNDTSGSTFSLTNSTLIAIAPEAPVFLIEDYNYSGEGSIFVQNCLFADISEGSYSTRTGQVAKGYSFNPTTNEAANAESMTTRTELAYLYGANSNTSNNPLCGPVVDVTFADLNNFDFTITGGSASKGNPTLYQ